MTGNLISKVRYFTFSSRWQSWTSFLLVRLIGILNHSTNPPIVMYVNVVFPVQVEPDNHSYFSFAIIKNILNHL